jgi:hypothetical protein
MSERERDIFDDLDALKVGRPDVERAPIKMIVKPARVRKTEPFGMIGLSLAAELGGTFNVIVHLAYQMALSDGNPCRPQPSERDVITDAPDSERSVCSKTLAGPRSNGETTAPRRWSSVSTARNCQA